MRVLTRALQSLTRQALFTLVAILGWACETGGSTAGEAADARLLHVPADATPEPDAPQAPDASLPLPFCPRDPAVVEARIDGLLAQLTPEEKVALMQGAANRVTDGVWLVRGNERTGVPGLRMLDGPRGVSAFTNRRATAFPVAMMRGATWDPSLEERVGRAIALEIRAAGADTLLAPTINLLRHPRWGRAQETYSEDTMHIGELAVAFIRGVQAEGVLASTKHFAVNSIENTRHRVDVQLDERTLREIYLPHFRRAVVEARTASVMSAYNRVGGLFCDLNGHLLTDILKGEWGFHGFVESDWYLGTHGDVDSMRAGLDLEMPQGVRYKRLSAALDTGAVDLAEIDASVRRLLRAQLCFGLDERTPAVDDTRRETPEHLALAREVARRGVVLLRNEDVAGAPVLPLDRSTPGEIVILGRNADVENIGDVGSSRVLPSDVVTALEGLREGANVTHVPGTSLDAAAAERVRAARAAIIVTGLTSDDEGEGDIAAGDRSALDLPADEVELIRAVAAIQPRTVVILEGGAAITSAPWDSLVPALLFAFYPGSEGGRALADVVFGDHAPSGRLPFSVPVAEADLPPFDNVSDTVTYGFFHGYRHLAHEGRRPHYPFGFGLTYTVFAYADLRLAAEIAAPDSTIEATVRIANEGARPAIETVQLYVAAQGSSVMRAPEDLRSFAQVALGPGESRDVTLRFPAESLAYWDTDEARFVVEPGEYEIRVGPHSGEARLTKRLRIAAP